MAREGAPAQPEWKTFFLHESPMESKIGRPINEVYEAAKKLGTLATREQMYWILNNKESDTAKELGRGGVHFFLGDGIGAEGVPHIHHGYGDIWSHTHTLDKWRKCDRVVFVIRDDRPVKNSQPPPPKRGGSPTGLMG